MDTRTGVARRVRIRPCRLLAAAALMVATAGCVAYPVATNPGSSPHPVQDARRDDAGEPGAPPAGPEGDATATLLAGPARAEVVAAAAGGEVEAAAAGGEVEPPPPARAPGPIELGELVIDPGVREDDLRGFSVGFRYRWPSPPPPNPSVTTAARIHFFAADGSPIRAAVDDPEYRDFGGRLRVETTLVGPSTEFTTREFFIPFYAVELPVGQNQVTAHLEVDGGEAPLVRGVDDAVAILAKPPVQMVRVLVPRVEVRPGTYDAVLLRPHKGAPDLTWSLRLGRSSRHVIHQAGVHWDTTVATWDRPTPPFPWSEGDGMTISVLDEDAMIPDVLATFYLSYEELCRHAARGAPLSRGSVTHFSLEVRLVPPD